jgi:Prophage maintenance system killer protein
LATKEISYLSYAEAVLIHILLMRLAGETLYGVFDRALIESALARPQQAAAYEGADLIRQAASLCCGARSLQLFDIAPFHFPLLGQPLYSSSSIKKMSNAAPSGDCDQCAKIQIVRSSSSQ